MYSLLTLIILSSSFFLRDIYHRRISHTIIKHSTVGAMFSCGYRGPPPLKGRALLVFSHYAGVIDHATNVRSPWAAITLLVHIYD